MVSPWDRRGLEVVGEAFAAGGQHRVVAGVAEDVLQLPAAYVCSSCWLSLRVKSMATADTFFLDGMGRWAGGNPDGFYRPVSD
jgi:hypothetical protein